MQATQRTMTQYAQPESRSVVSPLVGHWTCRSFINDPDISKDFNGLEFGRGELVIEDFAPGTFDGRLIFGDLTPLAHTPSQDASSCLVTMVAWESSDSHYGSSCASVLATTLAVCS